MAIESMAIVTKKLMKVVDKLDTYISTLTASSVIAKELSQSSKHLNETAQAVNKAADSLGTISKALTSMHKVADHVLTRVQERWHDFADKVFLAAATVAASAYRESMQRVIQEAPEQERNALYRITYNIQAELGALDEEVRAAVEPLAEINMPLKPMKEWVKLSVKASKVLGISAGDFAKMAANLHTINVKAKATQQSMSGLVALAHKGYMALSEIPVILEKTQQYMSDVGTYGDKAFRKIAAGIGALQAALNNIGVSDWEQSVSDIINLVKGMTDYTNEESQKALAALSGFLGQTMQSIVRRAKEDAGSVFGDLFSMTQSFIKRMAGTPAMIEQMIGDPRIMNMRVKQIAEITGVSENYVSRVLTKSIEAYKDSMDTFNDTSLALDAYTKALKDNTTQIYENYKAAQRAAQREAKFEGLYKDIKSMITELMNTLKEAGHAFMISVGTPLLTIGRVIVSAVIKPIHALISAFIKLNDITGGLLSVFVAFNAIMFAFDTSLLLDLVNYWQGFVSWFNKTFPGISRGFKMLVYNTKNLGKAMWVTFEQKAPAIADALSGAAAMTKGYFKSIKNSGLGAASILGKVPKTIILGMARVQKVISDYRLFVLNAAKDAVKGMFGMVSGFISNINLSFKAAAAAQGGFVRKTLTFTKTLIGENLKAVGNFVVRSGRSISAALTAYEGFGSSVVGIFGRMVGVATSMLSGLFAFLATGPGIVIAAVVAAIAALGYFLSKNGERAVVKWLENLPKKVEDFMRGLVDSLRRLPDIIAPITESLATAIVKALELGFELLADPKFWEALGIAILKSAGILAVYLVRLVIEAFKAVFKLIGRLINKVTFGLAGALVGGLGDVLMSLLPDSLVSAFSKGWKKVKSKLPGWVKTMFGIEDDKAIQDSAAKHTSALVSQYEKYAAQHILDANRKFADTTQMQLQAFQQAAQQSTELAKSVTNTVDATKAMADKSREETKKALAPVVKPPPQQPPPSTDMSSAMGSLAESSTELVKNIYESAKPKVMELGNNLVEIVDVLTQLTASFYEYFMDSGRNALASSKIVQETAKFIGDAKKWALGLVGIKLDKKKVKEISPAEHLKKRIEELGDYVDKSTLVMWENARILYKAARQGKQLAGGSQLLPAGALKEGVVEPMYSPIDFVADLGTGAIMAQATATASKAVAKRMFKQVAKHYSRAIRGAFIAGVRDAIGGVITSPLSMTASDLGLLDVITGEPIKPVPPPSMPVSTAPGGETAVLADSELKSQTEDMVSLLRRIERNTARDKTVVVDKDSGIPKQDLRMKLITNYTF